MKTVERMKKLEELANNCSQVNRYIIAPVEKSMVKKTEEGLIQFCEKAVGRYPALTIFTRPHALNMLLGYGAGRVKSDEVKVTLSYEQIDRLAQWLSNPTNSGTAVAAAVNISNKNSLNWFLVFAIQQCIDKDIILSGDIGTGHPCLAKVVKG